MCSLVIVYLLIAIIITSFKINFFSGKDGIGALFCQNGKQIVGNFENGVQKGLETDCSGIDRLPVKKGLFYLLKN